MSTFVSLLDEHLSLLRDTLLSKRRSYGARNLSRFGELGILVRASDKVERLANLTRLPDPAIEALEDTWLDLAGYAVLASVMRDAGGAEPFERLETGADDDGRVAFCRSTILLAVSRLAGAAPGSDLEKQAIDDVRKAHRRLVEVAAVDQGEA